MGGVECVRVMWCGPWDGVGLGVLWGGKRGGDGGDVVWTGVRELRG